MTIAAICALISGIINLISDTGFTGWAWQLTVLMWVGNSYTHQKIIDRYEENI